MTAGFRQTLPLLFLYAVGAPFGLGRGGFVVILAGMVEKYGIGLMSGTSGDGIDAALVRFSESGIEMTASHTLPFSKKVRGDIADVSRPEGSIEKLCDLNVELGKLFGQAAVDLCKKGKVSMKKIDFIGSHGQTVRHQPSVKRGGLSSTLQIGESAEISAMTGCTVVSDFRPADIAVGGCGAPLAPIAHYELFQSDDIARIVHNLGGISNVTYLPIGGSLDKVWGFDTGPANSLIDLAVSDFSKGKSDYDKGGKIALKGVVNEKMFEHCMAHPYFKKRPPKSTGKEMFGDEYYRTLKRKFGKIKEENFLRTLSSVTARSAISQALREFKPFYEVEWIVCGGGAFNKAIVAELETALGERGGRLVTSSSLGVDEKSVEAILMAILAKRTLEGLPGNLPKVTGANHPAILGKVTPPPLPR